MNPRETTQQALDRLAKWRNLLAGWQIGTVVKGDPEGDAIRDHRELTLMMRCEVSALLDLLIRKGLITWPEIEAALQREANSLNDDLEHRFPGVKATATGLTFDLARIEREGWMKNWKK